MRRILLVGLLVLAAASAQAQKIGIAAVVNDTVITTADLQDRRDALLALSGAPATPELAGRLLPQALQQLINEALQLEEAKRLAIRVDEKELQATIAEMEKSRGRPEGSFKKFLSERNLSVATMEQQFRAQLAWNKVVMKRLRRNVTITDDEVARAQIAESNKAGEPYIRIAAISLPIPSPNDESTVATLARSLAQRLEAGQPFVQVVREVAGRKDVRLNPSMWVPEASLEPNIASAIRAMKAGEVTQPLRSLNTYQIVQLLDRKALREASPNTELVLKQIRLPIRRNAPAAEVDALVKIAEAARANPGTCNDQSIAGIENPKAQGVEVSFARRQMKDLSAEIRPVIQALSVNEVTEPFSTPQGLQLVMLCERMEAVSALPDAEKVKQQLFAEKIELEAGKHLRNLKRDAFIDIKIDEKS